MTTTLNLISPDDSEFSNMFNNLNLTPKQTLPTSQKQPLESVLDNKIIMSIIDIYNTSASLKKELIKNPTGESEIALILKNKINILKMRLNEYQQTRLILISSLKIINII